MRILRVALALLVSLPLLTAGPADGPLAPRPVRAAGGENCNYTLKPQLNVYAASPGGIPSITFLSSAEYEEDCPPTTPQPYCSHGAWGSTFRAPRKDKEDGTPGLSASDTILSDAWGQRVNNMMFWRTWNSLFNERQVNSANSNSVLWVSGLGELSAEAMGMRYVAVSRNRIGGWRLIVHQGDAEKKLWSYFTQSATATRFGTLRVFEQSFGDGGGGDSFSIMSSNGLDNHTWLFGGNQSGDVYQTIASKSAGGALNEELPGVGRVYDGGLTKNQVVTKIAGQIGATGTGETGLAALYNYLAPSRGHTFIANPIGWNLVNNSTAVMNMAKASWFFEPVKGYKLPVEVWAKQPQDNYGVGGPGTAKDGVQDYVFDPVDSNNDGVTDYWVKRSPAELAWTSARKVASEAAALKLKKDSIWNVKIAWPARLQASQPFVDAKITKLSDQLRVLNTAMGGILGQQRSQRFTSQKASFLVMTKTGGFASSELKDPLALTEFGPAWRSKFYVPAFRRPYSATHGALPGTGAGLEQAKKLCNSDLINVGSAGRQAVLIQPRGEPFPEGNRAGVGNNNCDMNKVRGAGAAIINDETCFFAWVPYQIKPPKLEWQSWVTSQIRSYVPKKSGIYQTATKPGVEAPATVGEPFIVERAQLQPSNIANHLNVQIDSVNFDGIVKANFTQVGITVEIGDAEGGTGFILPVRLEGPDGKGTWTSMISRRLSRGRLDFDNYKLSMVFPRTPAAQAQEPYCRDLSVSDLLSKCGIGFDPESNQWFYHVRLRTWWEGAYQVTLPPLPDGTVTRQIYSPFANVALPKSWTQAQRTAWYGAMRPWDCVNWPRYADPSQQNVPISTTCAGQRTLPRMWQKATQPEIDYPGRADWTAIAPYYDGGERWVPYDKFGKPIAGRATSLVADDVADWGGWGRVSADPIGDLPYIQGYRAPRPLFDPSIFECWDPVTDPTGSLARSFGLPSPEKATWCWMNIPVLQAQGTP